MNSTVIKNISHTFKNKGNSIKVIDEFSIEINAGETVAILGPSGCGKSTILRCIAGFQNPTAGTVFINGEYPSLALQRKKIGFAFQEAALLDWKTVVDNIKLPGYIGIKTLSEAELHQKTIELLNLMQLNGFEKYLPNQLSGGMKQRVALARALLLQPSLLLLDEPFGSLDLLTRSTLIVEFAKILLATQIPTIIVTHSIEEAVYLADRVCILSSRPCKIIREIRPELGKQKDFNLFEKTDFLHSVAKCRKLLLDHWNQNEN